MKQLDTTRFSEKLIWILTVVLLSSVTIFGGQTWGSFVLLAVSVLVLLIDAYQGRGKLYFKIGGYQLFIVAFALYCYMTALWGIRPNAAIEKGTTIIEIMLCMSIYYFHYSKGDSVKPLIDACMWSGYIVTIYAIAYYGLDTIRALIQSEERLENSFANINEIAMISAFSVVIAFYNILFIRKKLTLDNIFIIPCFVMIAATESRKSFVIVVLGILFVLFARFSSGSVLSRIIKWILALIILYAIFRFIIRIPMFSGILARMEKLGNLISGSGEYDHSAWIRQQYIVVGLQVFRQHPIGGIGIASSGTILLNVFGRDTYMHNNFVELLACGGIVGLLLYYDMYFYLIYQDIKYRKYRDGFFSITVILMLIFLVTDYGSISYYSKSRYFYLMIFFLEVIFIKRRSFAEEYDYSTSEYIAIDQIE